MYFNKKYKRVGPLFQGVYKAVKVSSFEQLFYVSAYIHRNPVKKNKQLSLQTLSKHASSLLDYLGMKNTVWLHKERVLDGFLKNEKFSYGEFVLGEDYHKNISAYNSFLIDF